MTRAVRRFALAAGVAGGLGLALPAAAAADSPEGPPRVATVSFEESLPQPRTGGTPQSTDSALLIGVGIAAVAGAAGLFAAAHHAARRS